MRFVKCARNTYSQYGEDGIVDAIFGCIGYENKYCFEAGAADGIMFSNTRRLVEQGWKALLIEPDVDLYGLLKKNTEAFPDAIAVNGKITMDTGSRIDDYLAKYDAPTNLDLLSLDVDGQEFHLWNSMMTFRPRVMIVELLPSDHKDIDKKVVYPIGENVQVGQHMTRQIAASKGYDMVAWTYSNMIFTQYELRDKFVQTKGDSLL